MLNSCIHSVLDSRHNVLICIWLKPQSLSYLNESEILPVRTLDVNFGFVLCTPAIHSNHSLVALLLIQHSQCRAYWFFKNKALPLSVNLARELCFPQFCVWVPSTPGLSELYCWRWKIILLLFCHFIYLFILLLCLQSLLKGQMNIEEMQPSVSLSCYPLNITQQNWNCKKSHHKVNTMAENEQL